ncbi:MAG: hypothetical protein AAF862_04950, partial [Pseudomonadota bacterium]
MARRTAYLKQIDPVPKTIERHMLNLGFSHSADYFSWCWANGFEGHLKKKTIDLYEEVAAFEAARDQLRAQSRLHKSPAAFLKMVCLGDLSSDDLDRPKFKLVAQELEQSSEAEEVRRSLLEMLLGLLKHDDLIFETSQDGRGAPYIRGLIKLHDRKALWLRSIADWRPKTKNTVRKFGDLTHHLFDQYGDVPRFMEKVWLRDDGKSWRYRDWYVHIGRGHNLRTAKSPVPLTKKMAHHFLKAPDNYEIEQGIRWGQLKSLGVADAAVHAVVATRLGRRLENEEFWFSVFRFIADNPMLDPRQIGPIIDY